MELHNAASGRKHLTLAAAAAAYQQQHCQAVAWQEPTPTNAHHITATEEPPRHALQCNLLHGMHGPHSLNGCSIQQQRGACSNPTDQKNQLFKTAGPAE